MNIRQQLKARLLEIGSDLDLDGSDARFEGAIFHDGNVIVVHNGKTSICSPKSLARDLPRIVDDLKG